MERRQAAELERQFSRASVWLEQVGRPVLTVIIIIIIIYAMMMIMIIIIIIIMIIIIHRQSISAVYGDSPVSGINV
jgi:hypothetical protein